MNLDERLAELGRQFAHREVTHRDALAQARQCVQSLHRQVGAALESFHTAVGDGTPHIRLTLGEPRVDDKHIHSVQFDLCRGRCRGIVTVKSRGEITFVGPFREGKTEGPCRTFPMAASESLDEALAEFLEAFIEEALRP